MSARIVVSSLCVYPVKACRGIPREAATIGRYGFEGDREWQVMGADGKYLTQRQLPRMALVRAEPTIDGVALSAPDTPAIEVARPERADVETRVSLGTAATGDAGDDVADWLARVLGVPARLVAIAEGYRRPVPIDAGTPAVEVSFADAAPMLLASTASLDDLVARASEPFPMERFRPNLVVDGAPPWAEDTWRRLRIGDATIHALLPWPRCAVPQVDQQTAERHNEPALVLRAHRWSGETPRGELGPLVANKPLFGVGVVVEPVGATIRVGDEVEVLELGTAAIPPPGPSGI